MPLLTFNSLTILNMTLLRRALKVIVARKGDTRHYEAPYGIICGDYCSRGRSPMRPYRGGTLLRTSRQRAIGEHTKAKPVYQARLWRRCTRPLSSGNVSAFALRRNLTFHIVQILFGPRYCGEKVMYLGGKKIRENRNTTCVEDDGYRTPSVRKAILWRRK